MALYVVSVVGLALMIVGLILQRRRFVAGSWLFLAGLVPSLISPTGILVLASGAWTANLVFSDNMLDLAPQTPDQPSDVQSRQEETTMNTFKNSWWRYAATFIAAGFVFLGIGNLQGDDGGPLYGKIIAAAVAVAAAGLIIAGLAIRRRNPSLGSTLIGVGTLPASTLILIFWFPPVALVGVLAITVTVIAFNDAAKQRRNQQPANISA
jgi:CHASE2 domain-containing sensor protein